VPRMVNQVCDHALLLAYVAGRKTIEPANVEEAWADLQQLPTPWSGEAKSDAANSGVIEFGSLDDSPEATDGATNASATSARAFRVASVEEEEAEAGDAEPSEQIHRIERLLAEADDDFQPAGSIGPEIELCLEDTAHPFQEEFDHEEVVSDRYAARIAAMAAHEGQPATPVPESFAGCPAGATGRPGGGGGYKPASGSACAGGSADYGGPTARVPTFICPTFPRVIS